MSLTGMVNVGKGAVVVGFAAGARKFGKPARRGAAHDAALTRGV